MNCQCQGIEELFNRQQVAKELSHYRRNGPDRTTRMLVEAILGIIKKEGFERLTLLDIGGGVGAIQHELLEAGVDRAVGVDASTAYIEAAREEAQRRGIADRVSYRHGDFAGLADQILPADIVTLDRVICCYPDLHKLVVASARRASKVYGLVFPRDLWWIRVGVAIANLFFRLRGNPYRGYVHPTKAVEALLRKADLQRKYYRRTMVWQVMVYTR